MSALRFDLSIARLGACLERLQKVPGNRRDFFDRTIEDSLVRLRGLVVARQFSDELQRGSLDLLVRRGRIEVKQRLDVPAHESSKAEGKKQKPKSRNQKAETKKQKPETRNQKPETRKVISEAEMLRYAPHLT
jgi:hypothetical protein